MSNILKHRIDFKVIFDVDGANPNGDPLNGNRPRQDLAGYGIVSDVAIKRKLRNRLQDMGRNILVQSNERSKDGFRSLKSRVEANADLKGIKDEATYKKIVCKEWEDVRAFGQVFAFKGGKGASGVATSVRGAVSIQRAKSITPLMLDSMQITKSVNGSKDEGRDADTMGTKHVIDYGVYTFCGSISPNLAEYNGFTEEDAEDIKKALRSLFINDESSARPAGSMNVLNVFWWEHDSKVGDVLPYDLFRSVKVKALKDIPVTAEDIEIEDHSKEVLAKKA